MKRILCALLSALLLLTLTACGGKKPAEDPSVQPPVEQPDTHDTPDPPAPSEAEQSLADLRETIRAAGAVLGCAYLGSTNGETDTDLTALLEGADCLTAYPFLREIPAEQVVAPGGWDIYCIVPADENADVAVNEYGWFTEGAELPELPQEIKVLHHAQTGRVHTLICRGSAEELEQQLAALHPIFIDAVPLSLEEIFIYELGGEDYAIRDIVL